MRALKIILVFFLIFILLAGAGLLIFFSRFDIQRFKPQIVKSASVALGRQVDFDAIAWKLSLREGLAFSLKGLRVSEDLRFETQEDFISIRNVILSVDILSSIRQRRFLVSAIRVDSPRVIIVRGQDGIINAQQLGDRGAADSGQDVVVVPLFFVSQVIVENGAVVYIDKSFTPEIKLPIDNLNVKINGFSLKESFPFEARAAILSDHNNIIAKGFISIDIASNKFSIFDVEAVGEVEKLSLEKIIAALPMLEGIGLEDAFSGKLEASVKEAVFSDKGILALSAQTGLSSGLFKIGYLALPFSSMNIKADIDENTIGIKSFSLRLGEASIEGSGKIEDYLVIQNYGFDFELDGVELSKAIDKNMLPGDVSGLISGSFNFKGRGFEPSVVLAALEAQGRFIFKDIVFNYNLLEDVLNKITLIPGLASRILPGLSADWSDELTRRRTVLAHAEAQLFLKDSVINLPLIMAQAQGFDFTASGKADFDQNISMSGQIAIAEELSRRMVVSVPELQHLMNENNMIEIPVGISGRVPSLGVSVGLKHIGSKIIQQKAREQVGRFLDRFFKQDEE